MTAVLGHPGADLPPDLRYEPVVFPMFGVECDQCGRPCTWWADRVTLPCGCGVDRRNGRSVGYAQSLVEDYLGRRPRRCRR